jgi:hypothetical protein
MEDNLKKNKNGRRPKKIKMEDDLKNNKKWKTTSTKIDNNQHKNGRLPKKNHIFSQILLNLGANLSWGWLSSVIFLFIFLFIYIQPASNILQNTSWL